MYFTKMHGLGNDYVVVNCLKDAPADPSSLARRVSDRHFGVGADGLILLVRSDRADVGMRIFNADGSEAEMCGNGIRCLAKYAFDRRLCRNNPMRIETPAGVMFVGLETSRAGKVVAATVDMGTPVLDARRIPVKVQQGRAEAPNRDESRFGDRIVDFAIRTARYAFQMTCVSMGNPHAVIYVEDVEAAPVAEVGPEIENHPFFPARTNVHFVQVLAEDEVRVRTWERGSGLTLACGTGASAVCVAGVISGRTARSITAHLPGGDLELVWRESDGRVHMTGPAVEVFSGRWRR